MRAFPQVIEDGRLYVVEPPLFGFTDNGKRIFVSTNREYVTYLYSKFSKNNDILYKDEKMSKTAAQDFLLRNEQYLDILKKVADNNICTKDFIELICYNLLSLGTDKKDVGKWDKMIKSDYSKQLSAEWNDGSITISGIKDGSWNLIDLNDDFINNKKTKQLLELMKENLGRVYGYSVKGNDSGKNLSIAGVLDIFGKYKVSSLTRYKGLNCLVPLYSNIH